MLDAPRHISLPQIKIIQKGTSTLDEFENEINKFLRNEEVIRMLSISLDINSDICKIVYLKEVKR